MSRWRHHMKLKLCMEGRIKEGQDMLGCIEDSQGTLRAAWVH